MARAGRGRPAASPSGSDSGSSSRSRSSSGSDSRSRSRSVSKSFSSSASSPSRSASSASRSPPLKKSPSGVARRGRSPVVAKRASPAPRKASPLLESVVQLLRGKQSNTAPSIPTKVLFSNNSDKSTVPGKLKSLKTLILTRNKLAGSLLDFAKDLRNMNKLKILNVSNNDFLGRIPPSILSLSSLEDLSLRGTNIKDSISMLTNSSNLEVLDLGDNMLDGFFPFHDLRNLSMLKILHLNGNNFSGRIPPSILSLNSLEALSLRDSNTKDSISRFCELTKLQEQI